MRKALLCLISMCAFGFSTQAFAYGITGMVFCDANTNGIYDEGDSPLAGIPVQMSLTGGRTLNTISDAGGMFIIDGSFGLGAGEWTVSITPNAGASIVAPAGGTHVIILSDPEFFVGADFAVDDPECRKSFCGDGGLDEGEQCDDGNNIDGDGCSAICTIEQCGNGFLDPGEQCDDGNMENGDGCSATCEIETGGEGCTPGYWKQSHHFDSYPEAYPPTMLFADAFGVDAFPGMTLAEATRLKKGGLNALGRHAVAALLNAASSDVEYDRTVTSVIESFQYAYSMSEYEFMKNIFESFNEQSCPLN
jgi:cysteine-rich repeat protein